MILIWHNPLKNRFKIMSAILKLKHWQIFLFLIGSIGLYVYFSGTHIDLGFLTSKELKAIFGVLGILIMFLWILAIGLLTNKAPTNPYRFRKGLYILSIVLCIIGYSVLHITPLLIDKIPNLGLMVSPLTPLTFFGIIYTFYNVSRSLKSLEVGRKVEFSECIIDALLLLVSPIGVWIIQPKINKIIKLSNDK